MRLTAIILLTTCLAASAAGHTQGVTLSIKDAPLERVFTEIRKQTGYNFLFSSKELKDAGKVSLQVSGATVEQVLALCFKDKPFSYTIENNTIVVKKSAEKKGGPGQESFSQVPPPIDVHGRITNENGEPVIGATVKVKGTDIGTSTNDNGEFTLNVLAPDMVLVISGVNIETTEVPINARKNITISVKMKMTSMNEVVINKGYYSERRLTATGNVSTVKGSDIQKQPVSNVLQALEGRVPGMTIVQNTGVPNGGFSVQIRGRSSINTAVGNDPLYIVDGVPYSSQLLPNVGNGIGITGTGNPLSFINPLDIERIDVLKDADATAIYGSRGANGVVLITTKKATNSITRFDINLSAGIGRVSHFLDMMDAEQYLQMRREAFKNDNVAIASTDRDLNNFWDTTITTDWQKLLIGSTAHYKNAQISISGGNANVNYLVGGNYRKETTVFPGDFNDQKENLHFNLNSASTNQKFRMNFSGSYLSDQNNLLTTDITTYIYQPPITPTPYNTDGSINWGPGNTFTNPLFNLVRQYKGRTNNLIGNALISYKIFQGLEVKSNFGYTFLQTNELTKTPISSFNPAFNVTTGSSNFGNGNIRSWIIEPQITYHLAVGKGEINSLVGTSLQKSLSDGQTLTATGYTSDVLLENLKAATTVTVQSLTNILYKYNAGFARINYNLEDKYLINLTVRRDGSSRFGPGKQFQNFYAIGTAWVFSKEKFISESLLNYGKLRFSYGTSGNDQIPPYGYLDLYNNTTYSYQGTGGLYPNNLFNPDFAWEINKKLEGAIDLGFLSDKILFSASYYRQRSSNQLVGYNLPIITGFTSIIANLPALVQNTGVEIQLSSSNIKSKSFTWLSSINITIPKNKLISYPNLTASPYKNLYVVGQPLAIQKVYHLAGVNPQNGQLLFTDANGNLTSSPVFGIDNTTIIKTMPDYYGGFQNSFSYKSISLDIFFQFVKQMGNNYLYSFQFPPGNFGFNQPVDFLKRWQKAGDISAYPRFSQNLTLFSAYGNASRSDKAYSDASFVRLKNLSVSYQIPLGIRSKLHLQNLRVYVEGENLITITKYRGLDPENQSVKVLPPLRIMSLGVQITL